MNRLYVLIRKDLSFSQQAVQAGHVVAEFCLNRTSWKNEILIYLGVNDLNEMNKIIWKLNYKSIQWIGFYEPDLNNELTSIAILNNDNFFKKMNLL